MTTKKTSNVVDGLEIPEGMEEVRAADVAPGDHARQRIVAAARTVEHAFTQVAHAIGATGICPPAGIPHVFGAAMGGVIGSLYHGDTAADAELRHGLTIEQLADTVSAAVRINIIVRARQEDAHCAECEAKGKAKADTLLSDLLASHNSTKH